MKVERYFAARQPSTIGIACGFAVGDACVQRLPALPGPWALAVLVLALAVCFRRGWRFWGALWLGAAWALGYGQLHLAEHLPAANARQQAVVEGVVLSLPQPMERGLRFDFGVTRVVEPTATRWPGRIRLAWYDTPDPPPKAGETWRFQVKLRPPRGLANPGGFDYERWLFEQNIRALGYVRKADDNRRLADGSWDWLSPRVWRGEIHERLAANLAGSPMLGLVAALTLGVDDGIGPGQWRALRRTGTLHLIAVSGSHIGLIALLAFFAAQWLTTRIGVTRWPPPSLAALAGFTSALLYSALADFSIPTQRALIMVGIAMGAVFIRRNLHPPHVLATALLAVLLYDPMAVLAPGFWLSFGAVALIAYAVSGRIESPRGLWAILKINGYTALGLAPLLLLFFGQISLVSPLANLLAVPILGSLLVPLCLVGASLSLIIPPLGAALLKLAELILTGFWPLLEWLSDWRWAQWTRPEPPLWTLFPALPGVLWLLAPRGVPARWLGLALLLPALASQVERPAPGEFLITLLDVGQGLAAVVETRHKTLVFDTGPKFGPGFDMGGAVIEPYLRQRGITGIDTLIVSHGDNDHIGGAESLGALLPIHTAYSSVPGRLRGLPARACHAGQKWQWDGVEFAMLGPVAVLDKENDNSCVLRVGGPHGSALLTGDIERTAESTLVAHHGAGLRSDVLIAPHHGSKTSSSAEFLAAVRPREVWIPAGFLNRFGFPHGGVLERYRGIGAEALSTADAGAISLWLGRQSRRESHRQEHARYWQGR